jgi:hypothetical protein
MNDDVFNIPDTTPELATWLERQIVGLDLLMLTAYLMEAGEVAENTSTSKTLEGELGNQLPIVLSDGLRGLEPDSLHRLLQSPKLLLDLQQRIFVDGGRYWDSVPRTSEHREAADRLSKVIASRFGGTDEIGTRTAQQRHEAIRPSYRSHRILGAAFAVAAALMIAIGIWRMQPSSTNRWGFDRPGVLTQALTADAYLDMLASAADEWFNRQPSTEEDLRVRLTDFRNGCTTLLNAQHTQLAIQDKAWLLEQCRRWRKEIDSLLLALDGGASVDDTRREADALAKRISGALRSHTTTT